MIVKLDFVSSERDTLFEKYKNLLEEVTPEQNAFLRLYTEDRNKREMGFGGGFLVYGNAFQVDTCEYGTIIFAEFLDMQSDLGETLVFRYLEKPELNLT
ncbi:MAG: hypothetical protein WC849_03105 [Candidatus Paceibacterota bacterium]